MGRFQIVKSHSLWKIEKWNPDVKLSSQVWFDNHDINCLLAISYQLLYQCFYNSILTTGCTVFIAYHTAYVDQTQGCITHRHPPPQKKRKKTIYSLCHLTWRHVLECFYIGRSCDISFPPPFCCLEFFIFPHLLMDLNFQLLFFYEKCFNF